MSNVVIVVCRLSAILRRTGRMLMQNYTGTADQRHVGTLPSPPLVIRQWTDTIPSGRLPNRGVDRTREEGNSMKVYTDVFEIEASDASDSNLPTYWS